MASLHWMNQNSDGSSNIYAGKEIPELDLTLKLGCTEKSLKNNTNTNVLNPLSMNPFPNPNFSNINLNSTPHQGARPVGGHGGCEYQYRMAEQPMNPGFGSNFPINNEGRIDYGLNKFYDRGNHQYSQNMINPSSSRVENNFNMMNNGPGSSMMKANLNPSGLNTATFAFPPPPITNEYTLIDTPARRNRKIEIHHPYLDGSSAVTVDKRGVCRQRAAPYGDLKRTTNFNSSTVSIDRRGVRRQRTRTYHVPKRCTNFNCGTTVTPMWRRGPLGPKTLCNACGIKYRKEEEKRKAKEASKSSG